MILIKVNTRMCNLAPLSLALYTIWLKKILNQLFNRIKDNNNKIILHTTGRLNLN